MPETGGGVYIAAALGLLAVVLPWLILRRISPTSRGLAIIIAGVHVFMMAWLHYDLIERTGSPIVFDHKDDVQKYYYWTSHYRYEAPLAVDVRGLMAEHGPASFGYFVLVAAAWTLSEDPILLVRLFKTFLFLMGMCLLVAAWRDSWGERSAVISLIVLGIVFTPGFYYSFRNLKDGLLLGLFLILMALLHVLLEQGRRDALRRWRLWGALLLVLYLISTVRGYAAAIVVASLGLHGLLESRRLRLRTRMIGAGFILLVIALAFQTGLGGELISKSDFRPRHEQVTAFNALQALLSPQPWNPDLLEPSLQVFYWAYWLTLPYVIWAFLSRWRQNLDWKLFVYAMIFYLVAGPIGDPPRKRLIVHPIMLSWVLAYMAHRGSERGPRLVKARSLLREVLLGGRPSPADDRQPAEPLPRPLT